MINYNIEFSKGDKVVAKKKLKSFGYNCACTGDIFVIENVYYNYVCMTSDDGNQRVSLTVDKHTFYECFEKVVEQVRNDCMNVTVKDNVVLIKEIGSLKTIGQVYEVARMTEEFIVIRDISSKAAVASINIEEFGNYFTKKNTTNGWTKWADIANPLGNMIAQYRTNNKKVEVRIINDMLGYPNKRVIRSTATCNSEDEFNLAFGVQLAYLRCEQKFLKNEINEYNEIIRDSTNRMKECESRLVENKSIIKKMLSSID